MRKDNNNNKGRKLSMLNAITMSETLLLQRQQWEQGRASQKAKKDTKMNVTRNTRRDSKWQQGRMKGKTWHRRKEVMKPWCRRADKEEETVCLLWWVSAAPHRQETEREGVRGGLSRLSCSGRRRTVCADGARWCMRDLMRSGQDEKRSVVTRVYDKKGK